MRLVLLHGTVTGPSAWDPLLPYLHGFDVVAPERPRTGSLAAELGWLATFAEGAWLVGMSGGATLGLAAVASDLPLAGAILHEPAVGSLQPGLLAPVAQAFERDGVAGLGRTLYGASWSLDLCPPAAAEAAAAELAMFRGFEPAPSRPSAGPVTVTYGALSPPARASAASALVPLGYHIVALPGAGHFVAHDHPVVLARALSRATGQPLADEA